ncbi:hypothetical protein N9768_00710, partial [Gammaproteobacteria bacterium]|nr:hypothetical protein [Gammaproteobacteria bacterium]
MFNKLTPSFCLCLLITLSLNLNADELAENDKENIKEDITTLDISSDEQIEKSEELKVDDNKSSIDTVIYKQDEKNKNLSIIRDFLLAIGLINSDNSNDVSRLNQSISELKL